MRTERNAVTNRITALLSFAVAVMLALPASAMATNVIAPATYKGTAATGGTIEFDVSPDGAEVTRFALASVSVPPCATITGQTPRLVSIVNDSFSNSKGLLHFSGSFPTLGQAQGTLSYHRMDGSCNSQDVAWTAAAPVPLPPVLPPPPPPPGPLDKKRPNTKIKKGPSGTLHDSKVIIRFTSTEAGSVFKCKLDRSPWRFCEPPKLYVGLKTGEHTFKVRAIDAAGNADRTPAERSWRVELR